MPRRFALVLAAPLALAACGETNRDVIAKYAPQFETVRADLKKLAASLPPPGTATTGGDAALTPKPVYDSANGAFNTAFLAVEELDGAKPAYNLILSSELANALAWTGANNPMAESALDQSGGGFDKEFETALATPYVVFYRAAAYDPPRAVDDKTFEGGTVTLEAFLFARADGKPGATCVVSAASADSVSYSYKQGEDPKERLAAFASSTLWENTLDALSKCLAEATGGTFVLRRP